MQRSETPAARLQLTPVLRSMALAAAVLAVSACSNAKAVERTQDFNAGGEYSLGLKIRFARNPTDGTWELVDMLDDLDRAYVFAVKAGGPINC